MKRNKYLNMKPLGEARAEFLEAFDWIGLAGREKVNTAEALGRIATPAAYKHLGIDPPDDLPRLLDADEEATDPQF